MRKSTKIIGVFVLSVGANIHAHEMKINNDRQTYNNNIETRQISNNTERRSFADFFYLLQKGSNEFGKFRSSKPESIREAEVFARALSGPGMTEPKRDGVFNDSLTYDLYKIDNIITKSDFYCAHISINFSESLISGLCQEPHNLHAQGAIDLLGRPEIIPDKEYFVIDGVSQLPARTTPLGSKILRFLKNKVEMIIVTYPDSTVKSIKFSTTI